MSGLGGACKSKTYFCAYCECSSVNDDLLGYASGSHASDSICAMCQRNGRGTCAHRNVNDMLELKKKGQLHMAHLLEDFQWCSGNENATIIDMFPLEPVDCYAGCDLDLVTVWETRSLRNLVGENGSDLLHDYIYDYSRNILHTEERGDVLKDSCIKCNPSAVEKQTSVTNIDFVTGIDKDQDDEFDANVSEVLNPLSHKSSETFA